MTMNDITDYFQFCKWVHLQYSYSFIDSDKISRLLFYPDTFARKLKNEGYDDEFIKTIIGYTHRYKIDGTKKNKLSKISFMDYEDKDDQAIIQNFSNMTRKSRIDYAIY